MLCQECSLNSGKPVWGEGNPDADIMLIGEAPGVEEEAAGRPFYGDAGKNLTMALRLAGFDRATLYITNVVKCHPPNNRKPSKKECAYCHPILDAELTSVNPRTVVLLGDIAVKTFFPNGSVKEESCTIREKDGREFLISYHPAAPLYKDTLQKNFEAVFIGLKQRECPATVDTGRPCTALDVEVDEQGKVFSAAAAQVFNKKYKYASLFIETLKDIGGSEYMPLIAHNASFDSAYIGQPVTRFEDTMLIAYLLDLPIGLKELSWTILGKPLKTLRQVLGNDTMAEHRAEVEEYNRQDAEATLLAYQRMVLPPKLEKLYREVDKPLVPILAAMEHNGLLVDREYLGKMKVDLTEEVALATASVVESTGIVNPQSTTQLIKYLHSRGITTAKLTDKGNTSTDEAALLSIRHLDPELIDAILVIRSDQKLLSTYVEDWLHRTESDSYIHPQFSQVATRTRRLASFDPDGQNIPPAIQKAVIAPPGYVLVEFDADQIEMRIAAVLSGDEGLLDTFLKGEDVHNRASLWLFNDVTPEHRYIGKRINFAVLFGGGAAIIAEKAQVALDDAKRFHALYFEKAPKLKQWIDETQHNAIDDGIVYDAVGAMRVLREIKSPIKRVRGKGLREAINTPIQMTAADILRTGMVQAAPVWQQYGAKLVLQVHDALFFYVPDSELEEAVPAIRKVLTDTAEGIMGLIPFPFSVKIGYRWGEGVKV